MAMMVTKAVADVSGITEVSSPSTAWCFVMFSAHKSQLKNLHLRPPRTTQLTMHSIKLSVSWLSIKIIA